MVQKLTMLKQSVKQINAEFIRNYYHNFLSSSDFMQPRFWGFFSLWR